MSEIYMCIFVVCESLMLLLCSFASSAHECNCINQLALCVCFPLCFRETHRRQQRMIECVLMAVLLLISQDTVIAQISPKHSAGLPFIENYYCGYQ